MLLLCNANSHSSRRFISSIRAPPSTVLKQHWLSPKADRWRTLSSHRWSGFLLNEKSVYRGTEGLALPNWVMLYLRYEAVQLRDSVPVRRVCGQPLWKAGLSTQLVPEFHLLPENGACSHIGTCLGIHTHTHTRLTLHLYLNLTTVPPRVQQAYLSFYNRTWGRHECIVLFTVPVWEIVILFLFMTECFLKKHNSKNRWVE